MGSTILVTGGTGTLGRLLVPRLLVAHPQVRILSRKGQNDVDGVHYVAGDLVTGEGVEAAVAGVDTVVHCAGTAKGDEVKTLNLVKAAKKAGVQHLVYISVVGAERIPVVSGIDRAMFGYFGAKFAAERIVAESGIPWTTLRATQFYDAIFTTAALMARMPVIPIPSGVQFQPVDADEVAARLAELTLGEPAGLVADMAGPRVYPMADLIRGYLQACGKHRIMFPMRLPGRAAAAVRSGANLSQQSAAGRRSWETFLAERVKLAPAGRSSMA